MTPFEPIYFAFKKIKNISFIQRTIAIYKNPVFDNYSPNIFNYSFIDFFIGLIASGIIALFIFQIFRNKFEFDILKIIHIWPLILLFVENALWLSISMASFSIIFFKCFNIKNNFNLFSIIFWRTMTWFSNICITIMLMALILINNIFTTGSLYYSKRGLWDLFLSIVLIALIIISRTRILAGPIYKILSIKGKIIGIVSVFFIFVLSCSTNKLLAKVIPSPFPVNKNAFIQAYKSSSFIKNNMNSSID